MTPRPTPYAMLIAPWADEHFTPVRQALGDLDVDIWDRDAFLMAKPVVGLIHGLRPAEGLGEGMAEFAGLVHAAYLFWRQGEPVVALGEPAARVLLTAAPTAPLPSVSSPAIRYVQFPPRQVWGAASDDGPLEPLDGCFVIRRQDRLLVVGILGAHPDRDGFTVVMVDGPRSAALVRPDGSPLFGPVMEGGAAAGLFSLTGMEELLELGWRTEALAG